MKIIKYNRVPNESIITKGLEDKIHYIDSFRVTINNKNNYSVDYLVALLFTSLPGWVRALLNLRNILVKPFGLVTGKIPEQKTIDKSLSFEAGEKAIIFKVIDKTKNEIVMGEDDKHLYFRTSLLIKEKIEQYSEDVFLTTVVQFHNFFGRIYFRLIKPFHKLLMKKLLINFVNKIYAEDE